MKKILNSRYFWLILYAVLLIFSLRPYYRDGRVILGQEGNNFLDFAVYLKNYRDTWQVYGMGTYNTSVNSSFPNIYFLVLLQNLINNEQIVNFILIFLVYFLPFLAIFQLAKAFEIRPVVSFFISLFYIVNPFTLYYFSSNLNHWNVLTLAVIPLFFWLILKFYHDNFKLFLFFGLASLMSSFVQVNPPLIAISQIALILSVMIISYFYHEDVSLMQILKKYLIVLTSFLLFNFWWLINWAYLFYDIQGYSKQFALSWLRGSGKFLPLLWKTFNLISLLPYPLSPEYDFFDQYYAYTPIFLAVPILILVYFLLRKKRIKKYQLILSLLVMLVAFLAKGVNGLFGGLYEMMVMHIPFFSIFKTAAEKWGVLFIFLLTLSLVVIFKELEKSKFYRYLLVFFVIYIIYSSVPLVTSNFVPDYKFNDQITGSRRFIDKLEYQNLREELNDDPEEYRVLSLPGSLNYQVALQIESNKFYTGLDPLLSNINKAFVAPYTGTFANQFGVLFDKISQPDYLKLLGFYNIKKIVINKDMYPWFGFREKESIDEIEAILDKNLQSSKNKAVALYDVGDYYLPKFYVPQEVIYSPFSSQSDMTEIVSVSSSFRRPALFINPYEEAIGSQIPENDLVRQNSSQILVVGNIQSAVDEEKLRAGVSGMDPGGVLFPYARWKPGNPVYPYILKKEEKTKRQFLGQPEEMFEQHLFFAAKRITEIQRWNKKLTKEQFVDVLTRYQDEMAAAIRDLNAVRQTDKESFTLLAKIEVSFAAHQKRLLDVIRGDYGDGNARVELAESILEEVDRQLKGVLANYSQTKYYFEIPESGEYDILMENLDPFSKIEMKNVFLRTGNELIASDSTQLANGEWVPFGKKLLDQGGFWLEFIQPALPNLLTQDWQKLASGIEIDEEAKLFGETNEFTIYQDIKEWQPQTTYKFSLEYKTNGGRLKVLLVEEKEKVDTTWRDKGIALELPAKTNILIDKKLEVQSEYAKEWQDFSAVVNSGRNTKAARLFITNESKPKEVDKVEFKNAKLEIIIEPKIVLKKNKHVRDDDHPTITFQKINPTKYIVNVENAVSPYFLVFSESFHHGWKAHIKGQKLLADDRHVMMNGYANSWYLTPEDADGQKNYQIIIEYWGQQLFYLGILVTLATVFLTLAFGFWRKIKIS